MISSNRINLSKSLFLCDVEGYEYELFNDNFLELIQFSYIIIEIHYFTEELNRKREIFLEKIDKFFNTKIINFSGRDLSTIPELKYYSDLDRALIISEGRSMLGEWVVLTPKYEKVEIV